jgi:methionyl-tRNA formyltransferase
MRTAFVTCVKLGLACMEQIYNVGGSLDLVITLPDDKAQAKSGRVLVDHFCQTRGIKLQKFVNVNDPECVASIRQEEIDWLFIIGWSQIAKAEVLSAARKGVLGMHPTLLPEGRGRAAIPWAILKGLDHTGVTLFQMDAGVDTGPILGQLKLQIDPQETATQLYERVETAHEVLIGNIWPDLLAGTLVAWPQDESKATVWPGRKPEDGRISAEMSVAWVERLVRATTRPYPGAFWEHPSGRLLRIWAGRVLSPTPAEDSPHPRICLRDGVYEAASYDWEGSQSGKD